MDKTNLTLILALRHKYGAAMANLKDRADRESLLLNHLAHDCIDLANDIHFLCNLAEGHPDKMVQATAKAIRAKISEKIKFRDFEGKECGAFDNQ